MSRRGEIGESFFEKKSHLSVKVSVLERLMELRDESVDLSLTPMR
jgi:hypothetical protein